jgi:PAS domain S-box-containing protein
LEQRRQAEAELQQHQNQLEALVELRTQAVSDTNTQLQQEIAERTQAETALRQSEAILAVVAHIARQLLEANDWREQIQTVLTQLGQVSQATHVYVFENHLRADGELLTSQRYEWVMPGFQSDLDDLRLQNVIVRAPELDDWYGPLLRGEPFYSSSRNFSEHWSESLTQRGIKTLLDVPIFVAGQWWGLIGFDDCVSELAWSQVEINALRTAAGILGAAIQRQRIETQLREREERYRLISEVISDYTFSTLVGAQGELHLNWVAGAFEKITGYMFDEYVARGGWLAALYPDDIEQDAQDMTSLRARQSVITEVRTISKSGAVRWVRVYAHPIWDEAEDRLVSIYGAVQDITERKQAEAEREALIHELEARNAELERFAYTISHDLKSPLITIRGFLGFVEQNAREGNWDRMNADMARIVEATDKMRRLLDELLELSRIGRLMNSPEAVPFEAIVQEAIWLVQGRLEARGVLIEIRPALPVVYGDRTRLVEVVQNLIDNACKFMGDQAEPRITIGQQGSDRDGKSIVFVRDNGIGIDPQYHQKVFGLFDKLDPRSEGTGIGLALVKRIVEVHGGRIWVESEPGRGATFYLTI